MKRRAPHRPQRVPIFIDCEGESEVSYVALLATFARDSSLPVHLHAEHLTGAGDPLSRVERALQRLQHIATRRGPFRHRFILMDDDQVAKSPDRANRARALALQNGIQLIWQQPCHEAFLLRHHAGCDTHRPPDSANAGRALEKEWPQYRKPMAAIDLRVRMDIEAVYRVARVEPEFAALLRAIGLIGFE